MAEGKVKRMWALPNAEITAPKSLLMHGGSSDLVTLPCPAYLIEHPKGLVLFDTGCHPKVIDDVIGYWGPLWANIPVKYSQDLTLDRQIKALGYKLEDVKYVVISHLHLDHSSGMYMFPNAKFIIGRDELRYAYWPDPDRQWAFILEDLLPTRKFRWIELDTDFDLFDDGSLHFLKTPGHTPGECSLFVRLPNRKILLVGDSTHLREALENEATMPIDYDPVEAVLSLKRIKAIRDMHEASIWISHDPEDWAEFPHAPKPIE
jgi:N-acyl homoserine lactone hydrolase